MSEGAAVVPVAAVAVVALPIVAVAAVGTAALLAVRGCVELVRLGGLATEAAGRAAERLGEELEATAQQQARAEVRDRLWNLAATEVLGVNRSINLLRAQARASGISVEKIPVPLRLEGESVATMHQWLARTEPALKANRAEVHAALAAQEQRALIDDLPAPVGKTESVAEMLALFLEAIDVEPPPPPARAIDWTAKAAVALRRLDKHARPEERRRALRLAAEVAAHPSEQRADIALKELGDEIKRIESAVAARKRALAYLGALDNELIAAAAAAVDPREPHLDTSRRLRAVADADAVPDDDLWALAERAIEFAREVALSQRKLEAVGACLAARGYSVTAGPPGLRVTRAEWRGQHSADIWVPADRQVHHELMRDAEQLTDEAARCRSLNRDLVDACEEIAGALPGTRAVVDDHRIPNYRPNVRPAHSDAASTTTPTTAAIDPLTGEKVTTYGN